MSKYKFFYKAINMFNIIMSIFFIILFVRKKKKETPLLNHENLICSKTEALSDFSDEDFIFIKEPQLASKVS